MTASLPMLNTAIATDRELLELAAKAAGIRITRFDTSGNPVRYSDDHGCEVAWNPLATWGDSDTLRLAVVVGKKLDLYLGKTIATVDFDNGNSVGEVHGDDPYAATRRAIVRAAAEIGKVMP